MNKKKIADEVFDLFPKQDEVFVAFDGQAFFNEHSALNHSKELNGKQPLAEDQLPEKFTRSAETEKPKTVKLNAEQLIEKIAAAETAEQVDEIVGADNRATVVKAAEAKKAALLEAANASGKE